MPLAFGSPVKLTKVGKHRQRVPLGGRIPKRMSTKCFFGQDIKTATLNSTVGSRKATCDYLVLQTERFEDLSTLVTSQRANPHFRHDLQHSLGDRLAITRDYFAIIHPAEQSVAACLPQGFKGQIRIDRVGTIPNEQTVVVHFAGFTRFQYDSDPSSFCGSH